MDLNPVHCSVSWSDVLYFLRVLFCYKIRIKLQFVEATVMVSWNRIERIESSFQFLYWRRLLWLIYSCLLLPPQHTTTIVVSQSVSHSDQWARIYSTRFPNPSSVFLPFLWTVPNSDSTWVTLPRIPHPHWLLLPHPSWSGWREGKQRRFLYSLTHSLTPQHFFSYPFAGRWWWWSR